MALIACVECGGKLSDKAKACPHCGSPVEASLAKPSVPATKLPPLPAQKPPPQKPPLSLQPQPPLQPATKDSPQESLKKSLFRSALYFCLFIGGLDFVSLCLAGDPHYLDAHRSPGAQRSLARGLFFVLIWPLWRMVEAIVAARAAARATLGQSKPSSYLGPWWPQVLMPFAITAGLVGALPCVSWMALVTAWNWWRCGRVARVFVPAIIGVLGVLLFGLAESGAMDNVEISESLSFLLICGICAIAAAILCFDLWLQRSAIRLREDSGQYIGFHVLPCGVAALILLSGSVASWFMFGE